MAKRKTTRKTHGPELKMAAAVEVVRGERTLGQVAVERDFLRRFLDERGYDPGAQGGRR